MLYQVDSDIVYPHCPIIIYYYPTVIPNGDRQLDSDTKILSFTVTIFNNSLGNLGGDHPKDVKKTHVLSIINWY